MDNEEEQQQPDRKRGLIDRGNSAYNTVRNLRNTVQNAKRVVAVVQKLSWVARLGPVGWAVIIIVIIMLFVLLFSGGGGGFPLGTGGGGSNQSKNNGINNNVSLGRGCPSTAGNDNPNTCHYLAPSINLFSVNISQASIDKYVEKYSAVFINGGIGDKSEFIKRVNYIVDDAKQAGLNPALFLGYWRSESRFGTASTREMGCSGDNFYTQVDCALGLNDYSDPQKNPIANCAKSRDSESVACKTLQQIRVDEDLNHPIKYPISTFDDFAEAYGPISDGIGNCTSTYNVLLETAKELNACTALPTNPQTANVPPAPSDIKQGIIDSFGINMEGFDQDHLLWTWEKLWETSSTDFPTLLKGSKIVANSSGLSEQTGCPGSSVTVRLGQYTPADFFKFMLIHELGHVIQSCLPRAQSQYNEAINAYNIEGGISYYANNASSCPGTVNVNENYADMIAYYLNSNAGLASGPQSCGGPKNPPNPFFGEGNYPLHYSAVDQVLRQEPNI